MSARHSAPSRRAVLAAAAVAALAGTAPALIQAQGTADPALAAIMNNYAAALRSGNVEALVALYAPNGVFMREDMPAVVGRDALGKAYREVFSTLKVDLAFTIQETEVAGDMAWLRSTSTGRIKILATGAESSNSFNELVVFRREGGAWKIRSYIYASNKPGSGPAK